MKQNVKMFIGYDTNQSFVYHTARMSVLDHSSIEVEPLHITELQKKGLYWRNQNIGSTEFSFTRFLVPYLKGFNGYAIFCDSDFIWNSDPIELLEYINPSVAVSVVKHDIKQEQLTTVKMDNKQQMWYPKKNWSSLMVFNCDHEITQKLTPTAVSEQSPAYLHQFEWCNEDFIGEIPHTYNYLVGYYNDNNNPKAIHYTDGGPWHAGYETVEFFDKWNFYRDKFISTCGKL